MGIFSGNHSYLQFILLSFGSLLIGMQIGYTVHYTAIAGVGTNTHYEFLLGLHDLLDEGLITEQELKLLVAEHRQVTGHINNKVITGEREGDTPDDDIPVITKPLLRTWDIIDNGSIDKNNDRRTSNNNPRNLCDGGNAKQKKLVFIKTHKTGSSTVTNILHRVIQSYGYSPAVPTGNLYYAWPSIGENSIVESVDPRIKPPYNIAGSGHSRYNRRAYDRIMGPGTHYVTVVRNPRSHIYSSFSYWSVPSHIKFNKGPANVDVQDFIKDVKSYWKFLRRGDVDLLHNNMCYDLGGCANNRANYQAYEPINFKVKGTTVKQWVEQMNDEFSLILITDYMDESLVLLKQLMCWETKDIIYLGLKMKSKPRKGAENQQRVKQTPTYKLTQSEVEAFAPIDTELYRFFNQSLWNKIEAQGPSFYDELHEYRGAMWEFSQRCRKVLGANEYSDDSIRYFLEDDPNTPEEDKPCWEAILDSGGFVKHLKREFGVHPSRTECIAQAQNRHILQIRHDHPLDEELYKVMLQGVVEFQSQVDFSGAVHDQTKQASGYPTFARCKPSFSYNNGGSYFHLAANYRMDTGNIRTVNPQLGLKRVTIMRDPVTEFLHAWLKLDVGSKLGRMLENKKPSSSFFSSQEYKERGGRVSLKMFVDHFNDFKPFIDEALGLNGPKNDAATDLSHFGICDRMLFNRQICKMFGTHKVFADGNFMQRGTPGVQSGIASMFDTVLVGSDMGGSLVLLRRWLCWPIELVSMMSASNWAEGQKKPLIPTYTTSLDEQIRNLNAVEVAVYEQSERQIRYHRDHSVGFRAEADELEKIIKNNEETCRNNPGRLEKSYPHEIDGVNRISPPNQCEILQFEPQKGDPDMEGRTMNFFGIPSTAACNKLKVKINP
jgi:hypothetical protein